MVCCLPESIWKTESETESCSNQMNPIQFDLKLSICPAVLGKLRMLSRRPRWEVIGHSRRLSCLILLLLRWGEFGIGLVWSALIHFQVSVCVCVCVSVCCWVIYIPVCVYLSSYYCLFGCIYLLLLLFVCLLLFTVVLYCSAYCLLVLFIVMVVLISKNKKRSENQLKIVVKKLSTKDFNTYIWRG